MTTVLTNAGIELIVDKLLENSQATMEYVAWGSGGGTPAATDTTLSTEESESRVSGTRSKTGSGATSKWQNVATITAAGAKTITEAGVFTASTSGTLVIHGNFTGIVLATGDKIEFTITLAPA